MTRSTQRKRAGAAEEELQAARAGSEQASMKFRVDEDNGGRYHWMIVADGGETLVRSAGFGSYEDANQAAGRVHRGASHASFEDRPGAQSPVALSARRDAGSHDDSDAERWLDEGGSFTREAVTR